MRRGPTRRDAQQKTAAERDVSARPALRTTVPAPRPLRCGGVAVLVAQSSRQSSRQNDCVAVRGERRRSRLEDLARTKLTDRSRPRRSPQPPCLLAPFTAREDPREGSRSSVTGGATSADSTMEHPLAPWPVGDGRAGYADVAIHVRQELTPRRHAPRSRRAPGHTRRSRGDACVPARRARAAHPWPPPNTARRGRLAPDAPRLARQGLRSRQKVSTSRRTAGTERRPPPFHVKPAGGRRTRHPVLASTSPGARHAVNGRRPRMAMSTTSSRLTAPSTRAAPRRSRSVGELSASSASSATRR